MLLQDYCLHQIIIVDDGNTADIAKTISALSSIAEVEVVRVPMNSGLANARNVGFSKAKGVFVRFLDADDAFTYKGTKAQLEKMSLNSDLSCVVGDFKLCDSLSQNFWTNPDLSIFKLDTTNPLSSFLLGWERGLCIPIHCVLFKTDFLKKFNPLFKTGARAKEDWIFWSKISSEGAKFAIVEEVAALYRQHGNNMCGDTTAMAKAFLEASKEIEDFITSPELKIQFYQETLKHFFNFYVGSIVYQSKTHESSVDQGRRNFSDKFPWQSLADRELFQADLLNLMTERNCNLNLINTLINYPLVCVIEDMSSVYFKGMKIVDLLLNLMQITNVTIITKEDPSILGELALLEASGTNVITLSANQFQNRQFTKEIQTKFTADSQNINLFYAVNDNGLIEDGKPSCLEFSQNLFDLQIALAILDRPFLPKHLGFTSKKAKDYSKRKKILFVSEYFPSKKHGGGLRLWDIITKLSASHDVYLYSKFFPSLDSESYDELKNSSIKLHITNTEYFETSGVDTFIQNEQKLSGKCFDLIQLEYEESLEFATHLRQYSDTIAFTLMECTTRRFFTDFCNNVNENRKTRSLTIENLLNHHLIEQHAFLTSDLCVLVTKQDEDFAKKAFIQRAELAIVPTSISDSLVLDIENAPLNTTDVLFVGSFNHAPNVEGLRWYLSNIHPLVLKKHPQYKLRIVGSGPLAERFHDYIDNKNITIVGWVDDLSKEILPAKFCIAPIISGAGIRGKIIQYVAAGKPTVSTSLGSEGLEELINIGSIHVGDDADSFASAVNSLLDSKQDSVSAEKYRAATLKYFSVDSVVNKLITSYANIGLKK